MPTPLPTNWNFKNLTNQRFGKLLVVELVPKEEKPTTKTGGGVYWRCLCDCGNTTVARASDLQQGRIRSCKCIRNTLARLTPEERLAHRRARRCEYMRRYNRKQREKNPRLPQALRYTPEQLERLRKSRSEAGKKWRSEHAQIKRVGRHGLTYEEYLSLLESQQGRCAICKRPPAKKALAIDHDHSHCKGYHACPQCVRGLLCSSCNHSLGLFGDSIDTLQSAIDYLKKWQAKPAEQMLSEAF